ncbi:unnamed protein product [Adineta steineri]|uniref:CCHC-type domain-containing protein n=1 Tax=Adineta steineri TaxID=433720 RepID=A0A814V818_9BILA|nr:unnamed protein product [Adineta steineri]CAF1284918.1 unnamed protein product [Adineta steineri]CAF3809151.1 unnamed protein product [Adineta steineri]CAF4228053.1 unnamed protein product [Adineta steineri]
MATREASTPRKPYQITFITRDEEKQYTSKLLENCKTYNGDPDELLTWLKETGAFITKEIYPETDHPFIIRHLLIDDALDYYQAHEDIIFNFYDLRKLFLHKYNVLAPLRTLSSLESIATLTLNSTPSILTSTQLPVITSTTTNNPPTATTFSFAQSLDDLTQNDIRKTIIEDLQRNTAKFTGDHRQDIIKWLKYVENKFETAGIPDAKKFDLISQLLDKGALDWFLDNKTKFNSSWITFVDHLKKTFDSPNRARIAMQKLHSYTQSPQQDIRSFCCEMRKLFIEADPQMSPTMKLELLLAKVNPSYRLDLLKQKPKDSEEFELMAKDLENTYLVFDAIEQNIQSNTSFSYATAAETFDTPTYSSTYRQPSSLDINSNNNTYRYSNPSMASPRYSSPTSVGPQQRPSLSQPFSNRHPGGYNKPRNYPRQKLFAYQSPVAPPSQHHQPSASHNIPPLMSSASPVFTHENQQQQSSQQSSLSLCQLCSNSGHSARDCPFQSWSQ